MNEQSRRDFLNDVGRGMILTGLGASLAAELGVGAMAREGDTDLLDFGKLRPLVGLMQNTNVNKLQPILVKKLKAGQTDLKSLIAAAALANAETFGGQDYVGFHTEMALLPALQMSKELPTERQALPILKVLYRNTARIQETGRKKTLHPIEAAKLSKEQNGPQKLRDAVRAGRIKEADAIFAATMSQKELDQAYNDMMWYVQDDTDIHQFVLAHRAYVLIDVVGKDHAHTLLRQSVRQCAHHASQRNKRKNYDPSIRRDIPKLVDQYKLLGIKIGKRDPGDKWVAKMAQTIYENDRYKAAEAIAASLAEGISPEVIGEAISLAANLLVLRQNQKGRSGWRCHGDSPGVHASDAVNAWRNMVRKVNERNVVIGLLVAAYYTARRYPYRQESYPQDKHRAEIKGKDAKTLLAEAEEAIRSNEQGVASAAIQIYSEKGFAARPVFDLMLRFSISEDGRLHSEKYYRTVVEEFATTRKSLRWRQLVSLARVTASAFGYTRRDKKGFRAPGYEEACRLLGVDA